MIDFALWADNMQAAVWCDWMHGVDGEMVDDATCRIEGSSKGGSIRTFITAAAFMIAAGACNMGLQEYDCLRIF